MNWVEPEISLRWGVVIALVSMVATMMGCNSHDLEVDTRASALDGRAASQWMDVILERVEADALTPPVTSRVLAYAGVAIYEGSLGGMPEHRSLAGQLNGLGELPHDEAPDELDPLSVLHATMGHMAPALFTDLDSQHHLIETAEALLSERLRDGVPPARVHRSAAHGEALALALGNWSFSDGFYGRTALDFAAPQGPQAWVPTAEAQQPLEPHWRSLRPFALSTADRCEPPAPHPFSTEETSEFYHQALRVWQTSQELTDDQRAIALFWADDPGKTSTPPGHWMAIASQMVEDHELNLEEAAQLFALLGIATGDAVIACWHAKYEHFLLRPVTYIQRYIDPDFQTLIATPPFPEFTSGHSTFSGAASTILTAHFGEIPFEDRTHNDRGFASRSFESFDAAAQEAAASRLFGGIHYPMGNEAGLLQGWCVGEEVLRRVQLRRHR